MNLPQSEVDRIEREANSWMSKFVVLQQERLVMVPSYIAGATAEASTAMSKAIAFAEWIRLKGFDIINSREKWYDPNLPYVHQVEYTTAELYALYSSQTETKL